jgi:hypothetical protein
VLYHLTYGADWNRDFSRNKAFGRFVTQEDRNETLDKFARVTKCWRTGVAPAVDLDGWRFNDYKTAIAKGITDDEFELLKAQVKRLMRSGLPQWKKDSCYEAFEFIREVREAK